MGRPSKNRFRAIGGKSEDRQALESSEPVDESLNQDADVAGEPESGLENGAAGDGELSKRATGDGRESEGLLAGVIEEALQEVEAEKLSSSGGATNDSHDDPAAGVEAAAALDAPPLSLQEWEDAIFAQAAEQADPEPCPNCKRTGFYGPRARDKGLKFRQCRFCGLWQGVGKSALQLIPVSHDCDDWPEVAGASYIWWVPLDLKHFECPYCDKSVVVKSTNPFVKAAQVTAPAEDPDHPWNDVPQGASYLEYVRFWEQWPTTKGRVVL